ncbi:MAG: hypothetical protein JWL61_4138 [Gemmatimonadetes bacterium]|jgi:hypothetical protein|nr:hypothetical protein [Gemmatimonadota bacterium]
MFNKRVYFSAVLVTAMACASGSAAGDPGTAAGAGRNADVISAAELADPAIASGDALEAVQRLRPRFLMTRGAISAKNSSAGSTHVSVDGGPLLTVDALSRLRPSQIAEIRYLSASDAAQRFGTNAASGGVILVKSK